MATPDETASAGGSGEEIPPDGSDAVGRIDAHTNGRRWDRLHIWQIQCVRDLLVLAAVVGLIWLGYAMRTVTTPLLIALALAYLFEPFVAWSTQRLRVRRPFVVGGLLAVLVTIAGVTLMLTVPLGVRQTFSLMDDVRSGRLVRAVVNAEQGLPEGLRDPYRSFLEVSGLLEVKQRAEGERTAPSEEDADEGDREASDSDDAVDGSESEHGSDAAPSERIGQGDADERGLLEEVGERLGALIAPELEGSESARATVDATDDRDRDGRSDGATAGESAGDVDLNAEGDRAPFRLADLDRDNGRSLLATLLDGETDDERVRRIVREELALAQPTATRSGPTRWLGFVHRGVSTAWSVLGTAIAISLLLFLIPFYFFFFSLWWPTVTGFLGDLIPAHNRTQTLNLLGQMDRAVAGFVRGRLVISAIVAVILAVGWYSIGVPYSIVLALVVGIFNLVPYLAGVGLPVAILLLAMDQLGVPPEVRQGWLWIALAPTIVFVIAQVLDGYVLTPLIAGKATDLDPVTIVVAIIAGGTIAGIYGMLIAIPLAACIKIILREIVLPKVKAWTRGEASDPLPIKE